MSESTVRDDIRSKAEARMEELRPLVEEYEEMQRIVDAMGGANAKSRAAPRRRLQATGAGPGGHGRRAEEAQQLIRASPGLTVRALAEQMGIGPTYLYRLLPKLERDGVLRKEGRGYHVV